jgi:hypothetical protein
MLRSRRSWAGAPGPILPEPTGDTMAEEESFKVTDRRGRAKESSPAEPDASPVAESRPTPGDAAPIGPGARPDPSAAAPAGGAGLQGLFVMFASSALINLGEAGDPATGNRSVDLEQAQAAIDMLLLLRDKTSGNRTEQESRLLEEILYDLQMRFVRAAEGKRPR